VPYKIGITGHFRTGKDTFADMLADAVGSPTVKLHFADALKYEVAHMLYDYIHYDDRDGVVTGWTHMDTYRDSIDKFVAEMAEDRQLNGLAWQWLGGWRRQKTAPDYWINHYKFQDVYREALINDANIIISDIRHINEARWCHEQGFYLIRIVGPCRAEGERRDPNHASEVHIDELEVDLVLPNYGNLTTLKELAEGMPSHIALTHVPHFYLAKNNA
jgi:hypothetical protein